MFLELKAALPSSSRYREAKMLYNPQSTWQAKSSLAFRRKLPSFLTLKLKAVASYESLVNGMTFWKTIFLL
jgi:hypothetical protein